MALGDANRPQLKNLNISSLGRLSRSISFSINSIRMAEIVQLQKVQSPRALFRQPLALQWFEGGELVKRKDDERQAGELIITFTYVE